MRWGRLGLSLAAALVLAAAVAAPAAASSTNLLYNADFSLGTSGWGTSCASCYTTGSGGVYGSGGIEFSGTFLGANVSQTVAVGANAVLTGVVNVLSMDNCSYSGAVYIQVALEDTNHNALGYITFQHSPQTGCGFSLPSNSTTAYWVNMPNWYGGTGPQSFTMNIGTIISGSLPGVTASNVKYMLFTFADVGNNNPSLPAPTVVFSQLDLQQSSGTATQTTLQSSANPSVVGQPVTYTATVSPVPDGGTVAFSSGGTPIGACSAQPVDTTTGQATCTVTYTSLTSATSITAEYSGDSLFAQSLSGAVEQVVNPASTTTTVKASPSPSDFGQAVTLTATVSPVAPGAGTPGGTVTFTAGAANLGSVSLSGGTATLKVSTLTPAGYTIEANYVDPSGDFASSSGSVPLTVEPAPTTTTVQVSQNGSAVSSIPYWGGGASPAFEVVVGATSGSASVDEGSVTVSLAGANLTPQTLGTVSLSGSPATLTVAAGTLSNLGLAVGGYTIEASYTDSSGDYTSSSAAVPLAVAPAATSLEITSTPVVEISYFGGTASPPFTMAVQVNTLTGVVNEGSVLLSLFSGSTNQPLTSMTVTPGGAATLSVPAGVLPADLPVGTYTLIATYVDPTGNFVTSSLAHGELNIVATATATTASPATTASSTSKQDVALTATVTGTELSGATEPVDEGTVTFTVLGANGPIGEPVMGPVVYGQAGVEYPLPAGLPVGSYTIEANFSGSTNLLPSSEDTQTLTVASGTAVSITEALTPATVAVGGPLTVSGAVYNANGAAVAGAEVQVAVGGATAGTATTGADGGYAVQATAPGTAGQVTVTATVAGTAVTNSRRLTVTAGPPALVVLGAIPSSVSVGGGLSVTGAVYDGPIGTGEPVPGATVTLTATGAGIPAGSIAPETVTTDANGAFQASYTAPQSTGQVTLSATAGTATATDTVTVTAASAPEAVAIALSPADPTEGYQPVQLTGSVVGLDGNPVPDVAVDLTASAPIFAGSVSASVYSGGPGSGVGTYATTFTAPATAGPVLITATVPSLDLSATTVLAVASVTPKGVAAGSTAPGGTTLLLGGAGSGTPDLTLAAAGGSGSGSVIVYSADPVTGSVAPAGASGFFDAGLVAGSGFTSVTIDDCGLAGKSPVAYWYHGSAWQLASPQAVAGGCLVVGPLQASGTSPTIGELAGTPFAVATSSGAAAVATVAGGGQSATVGTAFGNQLQAKVTDSAGDPVDGVQVTFTAPATGASGSFAGGATTVVETTDASGVATAPTFTANDTAGAYSVTASASSASPASFSLTNRPGPAAQLAFTTSPGGAVAGEAFGTQPAVTVQDSHGNTVSGDTSSVTLSITARTGTAGASLTGPATVGASGGVASFADLSIDRAGTGYTLTATDGSLGAATSQAFSVTTAAAHSVSLVASASRVAPNGTLTVSGAVYDAAGNPVAGATVDLRASGGSITATAVTNGSGQYTATFVAPAAAGQVTLSAAVAGTVAGASTTISVAAGGAAALSLNLSATTVTTSGSVRVSGVVTDGDGNPKPDAVVALSATAGAFAASGTVSESVYTGSDGGYTASFTAPGAAGPVTLTAAVPAQSLSSQAVLAVTSGAGGATGTSVSFAVAGDATAGGPGSPTPDASVTGSGGTGSVAVVQYGSDPISAAPGPAGARTFLDAGMAAGSTFRAVSVQQCGLAGGTATAYWWDAASGSWQVVSPQGMVGDCLVMGPFGAATSPDLAEMTGTPFAVAVRLVAGDQLKWSPAPLAGTGALAAGQSVSAAVDAEDGAGNPIPGATVYLSLARTTGGGSATVGGVALSSAPQAFAAGSDGQVQVLYKAPATLPASGVDVLTAASAGGGAAVAATDSYSFGSAAGGNVGASTSSAPSSSSVSTGQSVGTAGGTLATSDGAFSLRVPAGAIASGTLALAESCATPGGLPAGFTPASCVFALTGTALSPPQAATLRYNAAALNGLSAERLAVYAQAADGGWHHVPAAVDTAAGTVSVQVGGPVTLVVLAATRTFPDVPAGYWARGAIDRLLAAGVVTGMPDGSFQPDGSVTRAEFVKMLDLTLGLQPSTAPTAFTDVAPTAWYAPYVSAALQAGLVDGVSATMFDPNGTLSRQQMAVLVARALKLSQTAALAFSDAGTIAPWAQQAVEEAVAAGYLHGFPGGSFQPLATASRAQAAQVLAMVLAQQHPAATSG